MKVVLNVNVPEASNLNQPSNNGNEDDTKFESGKNIIASIGSTSSGLFLRGRRILVDKAVDKNTAQSLKVQRDEDGKPIDKKIGKDRRNLYLKGEGRVEESVHTTKNGTQKKDDSSTAVDVDAWENLPESDQMKRGRAHQEKSQKLRSPLFFINPYRLSLRNLAKHVNETQLKTLMATGIKNGLEKGLVSKEDVVAHWRASGEMSAREIIEKLDSSEENDNSDEEGEGGASIIPPYNESDGYKKYIPSVFIDRDFELVKDGTKLSKHTAPSRGFGFAEFTHHAHALARLRELNNNTFYSSEYVAGGKKALMMKKQMTKNSSSKKKKTKAKFDNISGGDTTDENDFVGSDGKVRIPRLIVEFTVENKAKARKQAERKAQQLENALKQKAMAKQRSLEATSNNGGDEETNDNNNKTKKKKKKSRGAQQREKKRKLKEEGLLQLEQQQNSKESGDQKNDNFKVVEKDSNNETATTKTKKNGVKPLKKKKKVDKEESEFENMVQSHKKAFSEVNLGSSKGVEVVDLGDVAAANKVVSERAEITKKRWFD